MHDISMPNPEKRSGVDTKQVNYTMSIGSIELAKAMAKLDGVPSNVWVQNMILETASGREAEIRAAIEKAQAEARRQDEALLRTLARLTGDTTS